MRISMTSVFVALSMGACGGADAPPDATPDARPQVDAETGCVAAGPLERTLVTEDGVELIADLYTTGTVGDPGVILLHMIPPSNSKDNYPAAFIEPLVGRGFQVINVNRRGAPGSGGVAMDAYLGAAGKYDAMAARDFLVDHPCAVPAERIAVVGASNGTTTALDFSVAAAADMEQPAAMVFLSGGTYTENQHTVADVLPQLSAHPILFAFPSTEAGWNREVQALGPATWTFSEYTPGAHGTLLFDAAPESMVEVIDFLAAFGGTPTEPEERGASPARRETERVLSGTSSVEQRSGRRCIASSGDRSEFSRTLLVS